MFNGLAFFAVFILREKGIGKNASYKVPFYSMTPIVANIGAIYILGSTLISTPKDTLMSIGNCCYWISYICIAKIKKPKKSLHKAS